MWLLPFLVPSSLFSIPGSSGKGQALKTNHFATGGDWLDLSREQESSTPRRAVKGQLSDSLRLECWMWQVTDQQTTQKFNVEIQGMWQLAIICLDKVLHVTGGLEDFSGEIRKGPNYLIPGWLSQLESNANPWLGAKSYNNMTWREWKNESIVSEVHIVVNLCGKGW